VTWATALILAVLQGLTEFFPVSSSGHLALFQSYLERRNGRPLAEALAFDIIVHLGTLLAVMIYFRGDLGRLLTSLLPASARGADTVDHISSRREIAFLVISLLPTAIIGLALRSLAEHLLHMPVVVATLIGVTGLILLTTRRDSAGRAKGSAQLTWSRALAMGAAQGMAVIPGLSRSGLTIATGLATGLSPMAAFRLSFLISIPTIAGAALLELSGNISALKTLGWPAAGAALTAGLVALAALRLLSRTLLQGRFHLFAWYCFAVAGTGILVFTVWGGR
jgi:undecaprenyl-diphosphatase